MGLCVVGACAGMGMPLLPLVAGPLIYAISRWSPLGGMRVEREIAAITAKHTELMPGHPLQQRVAHMAQRMGVSIPRVFLTPPRAGEFNVHVLGPVNRFDRAGNIVILPASLYTVTWPGRPAAFTPEEQDAVIAHELAHIRNHDFDAATRRDIMRRMTAAAGFMGIAGAIMGVVTLGGAWLALACMAPLLGLSALCDRQHEFRADRDAARFAGAAPLASALQKLERTIEHMDDFLNHARDITLADDKDDGWPVIFRLRAGDDKGAGVSSRLGAFSFLSTHPPIPLRYQQLRAIAAAQGEAPLPPQPASVDAAMRPHLHRTPDGVVLPPFAIAETFVHDKDKGICCVGMGLAPIFNAIARGEEIPAQVTRRPSGDPRPSAP